MTLTPAFHAEAARLRALGYTVINPAEINPDTTMAWSDCMRSDIQQLVTCDSIAMLDGWAASRGARLEHHIAMELGMAPRLASFFTAGPPRCTKCGSSHALGECVWPLLPEESRIAVKASA